MPDTLSTDGKVLLIGAGVTIVIFVIGVVINNIFNKDEGNDTKKH